LSLLLRARAAGKIGGPAAAASEGFDVSGIPGQVFATRVEAAAAAEAAGLSGKSAAVKAIETTRAGLFGAHTRTRTRNCARSRARAYHTPLSLSLSLSLYR
jgi:hypothetical protein